MTVPVMVSKGVPPLANLWDLFKTNETRFQLTRSTPSKELNTMRSRIVLACFAVLATTVCVQAQSTWVKGYFKKDGTYVNGYYRNSSNSQLPKIQDYSPKWHEGRFGKDGGYTPGHYTFPGSSSNSYKPYKPYTGYKPYESTYKPYKPYTGYKPYESTYKPYKPYNPYKQTKSRWG